MESLPAGLTPIRGSVDELPEGLTLIRSNDLPKGLTPIVSIDPIKPITRPSSTLRRAVGDPLVAAAKGVVGAGESLVGLADIPTLGRAGKGLEMIGYDPKYLKNELTKLASPEARAAQENVSKGFEQGVVPGIKAIASNPSTIVGGAIESTPGMLLGGGLARGAMTKVPVLANVLKAGKAIRASEAAIKAANRASVLAGGLGEAAITAGQNIEQVRQDAPGGVLTPKQTALVGGSGVLTGILGVLGGKAAQRLGLGDIDTLMAGQVAPAVKRGLLMRIFGGMVSEGLFEELPQSIQEQAAQNVALGKPWNEGVAESGAMGAIIGGIMGAGANVVSQGRTTPPIEEILRLAAAQPPPVAAPVLPPPISRVPVAGQAVENALVQTGGGESVQAVAEPSLKDRIAKSEHDIRVAEIERLMNQPVEVIAKKNADRIQAQREKNRAEWFAQAQATLKAAGVENPAASAQGEEPILPPKPVPPAPPQASPDTLVNGDRGEGGTFLPPPTQVSKVVQPQPPVAVPDAGGTPSQAPAEQPPHVIAYRMTPKQIAKASYKDRLAAAKANKYPNGQSVYQALGGGRPDAETLLKGLNAHRKSYMDALGKSEKVVTPEMRDRFKKVRQDYINKTADDAELQAGLREETRQPERDVTVTPETMPNGALVYKDNEWHAVTEKNGKFELKDGAIIKADELDIVDGVRTIIHPGEGLYDAAMESYQYQEQMKKDRGIKIERRTETARKPEPGDEETPEALAERVAAEEARNAPPKKPVTNFGKSGQGSFGLEGEDANFSLVGERGEEPAPEPKSAKPTPSPTPELFKVESLSKTSDTVKVADALVEQYGDPKTARTRLLDQIIENDKDPIRRKEFTQEQRKAALDVAKELKRRADMKAEPAAPVETKPVKPAPTLTAAQAVNRRILPALNIPKDANGNPATHVMAKIGKNWVREPVENLKAGTQSPWEGTNPTELKAFRNGLPIKGEVTVRDEAKYRTEGENDEITDIPTLITGKSVDAETALEIADDGSKKASAIGQAVLDARVKRGGGVLSQEDYAGIAKQSGVAFFPDESVFDRSRQVLQIGSGVEGRVYRQTGRDVVFKVYQGFADEVGAAVSPVVQADGKIAFDIPHGEIRGLLRRIDIGNKLGFPPTEIVGITGEGGIVIKQPFGDVKSQRDNYAKQLDISKAKVVPASKMADPSTKVWLVDVDGKTYMVSDTKAENSIGDTSGRSRLNDPQISEVSQEFLDKTGLSELAQEVRNDAQKAEAIKPRAKESFRTALSTASKGDQRSATRIIKRILGPNAEVEIVDRIFERGASRLGKYQSGLVTIAERGDMDRTAFHEAYHGAEDMLMTNAERSRVEELEPDAEKRADAFMEYAANHNSVSGKLRGLFDRLMYRIKALFGKAGKLDELKALHARIMEGGMAGRERFNDASPDIRYRTDDSMTPEERAADAAEMLRESLQAAISRVKRITAKMQLKIIEDAVIRDEPTGNQVAYAEMVDELTEALASVHAKAIAEGGNDRRMAVKEVYDAVKAALPPEARGKMLPYLMAVRRGQSEAAYAKLNDIVEKWQQRSAINAIKEIYKRSAKSASVDIIYQKRIQNMMQNFLFSKPTAATLEKARELADFLDDPNNAGMDKTPNKVMARLIRILSAQPLSSMSSADLRAMMNEMLLYERTGKTLLKGERAMEKQLQEETLKTLAAQTTTQKFDEADVKKVGDDGTTTPLTWTDKVMNMAREFAHGIRLVDLATMGTTRLFHWLDGYKQGAHTELIKHPIDRAENAFELAIRPVLAKMAEIVKKHDFTKEQMMKVGIYATMQQVGGREKLKNLGYDNDIYLNNVSREVKADAGLMEFYTFGRAAFDEVRPQIRRVLQKVYNVDMKDVDNYWSMMTDWTLTNDEDSSMYATQVGGDGVPTSYALRELSANLKKNTDKTFTMERTGAGKQKINLDALFVLTKKLQDMHYFVHMAEDVKRIGEMVNTPAYGEMVGKSAQRMVRQWVDLMARRGGTTGVHNIRMLDNLINNVGVGTLGFRATTILIQPASLLNAMGVIGHHAVTGFVDMMNPELRKFVIDNMPEITSGAGKDISAREAQASMGLHKLKYVGMQPMVWMDKMTRGGVALGAYRQNLAKRGIAFDINKVDPVAVRYAQEVAEKTQASGHFKSAPLLMTRGMIGNSKTLTRLLTQFQTYPMNTFHLMVTDGIRSSIANKDYRKLAAILASTQAAFLTEGAIRAMLTKGFGVGGSEDDEDKPLDELLAENQGKNFVQSIPLLGSLMSAAKYQSFPSPVISSLSGIGKGMKSVLTAKSPEAKQRGMVGAIGSAGAVSGIPGVSQATQIISRRIKSDAEDVSDQIRSSAAKIEERDVDFEAARLYVRLNREGKLKKGTTPNEFKSRFRAAFKRRTAD